MEINSMIDAETFVEDSGVYEWEWSGRASLNGFAEWVHLNCDHIDDDNYHGELIEYLKSVGENPADYDL